jgi:DNA end-binding protein Ku
MLAPTWKGYIRLSLVSVPVRAHNARVSSAGPIQLHQLHVDCHSRIQYKKTCPIHGEVTQDNIVSGYEYAKGHYTVIDPAELDKLRSEDDKAITIDKFIRPEALDRVYLSGQSYYLLPEGRVGEKPFALIRQGMEQENRWAIFQVVLHGKEQLVLLRPKGRLLLMTVLDREGVVTKPEALDDLAPKAEPGPEERELARQLIQASSSERFDFAGYKNVYKERMTALIETKVAGKEVVAPPPQEDRQIINLMDALRQSIAQTQRADGDKEGEAAKPPRQMASSRRSGAREPKRKSS